MKDHQVKTEDGRSFEGCREGSPVAPPYNGREVGSFLFWKQIPERRRNCVLVAELGLQTWRAGFPTYQSVLHCQSAPSMLCAV